MCQRLRSGLGLGLLFAPVYVIRLMILFNALKTFAKLLHCKDVAKNGGESPKKPSTRTKFSFPTTAYINLSEAQGGGGSLGEDTRWRG